MYYTPNPDPLFDQTAPHEQTPASGEPQAQPPATPADTPANTPVDAPAHTPASTWHAATAGQQQPGAPEPGTRQPVGQEQTVEGSIVPDASAAGGPDAPTYWNNAYGANGYGMYPPYPPYGLAVDPQPRRPRRRWAPALLALVLLLTLGVGFGAGTIVAGKRPTSSSHAITIGAQSAPAVSVSAGTASLQQSVENVAKAVEPSVVKITSTGAQGEGVGSGDILTADGYIVTNDHVVAGFTNFTVTLSNGKSYTATVIGQDAQDDLAVVKIHATGLTPIAFADSSKAQVGEFVVAVGNPLAQGEAATFGTVSGLNGSASEAPNGPAGELTGLIQTTATIAPGNSGGALVNLQGQLLGIPTIEETNPDTRSASGIGYAISSNRVQYVAQQLIQHGSLTSTGQGFLGIQAEDVTPQVAANDGLSVQSGVLIGGFYNDAAGASPAQQAGLKVGDVITAVNGQAVNTGDDLAAALLSTTPGSKVTLTVVRGTSTSTVTVTLGEKPVNIQG